MRTNRIALLLGVALCARLVASTTVSVDCGARRESSYKNIKVVGRTAKGKVTNGSMEGVYETYRYGAKNNSWGYDVDLRPGFWELTLRFAETDPAMYAAGKRRFGIKVQGVEYERAFDPYAAAGNTSATPSLKKYFVKLENETVLSFRLVQLDGTPQLRGFEIVHKRWAHISVPYSANVGGPFESDGFQDDPFDYLDDQSTTFNYEATNWDLPLMYRTGREGAVAYRIPVEKDKVFDVTLFFAESDFRYRFPGARVFDIVVHGVFVRDFDIFATAGNRPVSYTFKSVKPKRGRINIRLLGKVGPPILNAFSIDYEGSNKHSGTSVVVFAMNVGGTGNSGFIADNATRISDVKEKRTSRAKWVLHTSLPEVFRTRRFSSSGISINVPVDPVVKETYTVDLMFTETEVMKPNARVMDIILNGRRRKTVDFYYTYGLNTAVTLSVDRVLPDVNGSIVVDISATKGLATLSGIVVRKDLNDGPAPGWVEIPVEDTSALQRRHEHCAVGYKGNFYLIGGRREMYVSKFDAEKKTWAYAAMPPIEIHHMQCVAVGDRILVAMAFTGQYPSEELVDRILWYHPKNDSWTWGATIPPKRNRGSAAVVVAEDVVFFINGNIGGHGAHSDSMNWFDAYDTVNDTWHVLPDTPVARDHGMATLVGTKIVVSGGRNGGVADFFNATLDQINVWDFKEMRWFTAEQVLDQPSGGALLGTIDEKYAVLAGGEGFNGIWGRTVLFDAEKMRFVDYGQGSMITPRHGTQLVGCRNALYAISGAGWQGGGPELDTIEAFTMDGKEPLTCSPTDDAY